MCKPFLFVGHYTTFRGLFGILESRTLWATHYKFLNDSAEIEQGSKYIDEAIEATEAWRNLEENSKSSREYWQNIIKFQNDLEIFITSFCGIKSLEDEHSKDGLLSQWRGYGNKGGFCIIFNRSKLIKSYEIHAKCYAEDSPGLFTNLVQDIIYDESKDHVKSNFIKELDDIKNLIETKGGGLNSIRLGIEAIMLLMTTIKHTGFREEKEVRFACINRVAINGEQQNQSNHIVCVENEAPRLKIPIDMDSIEKIVIGPQFNQDQLELIIRYHLERLSCKHIEIIKSKTPFIPR